MRSAPGLRNANNCRVVVGAWQSGDMTGERPHARSALDRIRARQELQLAAALWRADRPMATEWGSLLAVRGMLPASFSIARVVLAGAIDPSALPAGPV